MKRIASISLNVMILMSFVNGDLCNAQDTVNKSKYSCVPVAASIALRYFNVPHEYREIYAEINVQEETGYASLGDLVRVCEKRGLFCKGYGRLSLKQIQKYLHNGCVIVVYIKNKHTQHAVSLFEINGRIAAYDVLKPLHYVNMERFERFLSKKVLCVAVNNEPISSTYNVNSRVLGMSLAASLVIAVSFLYIRERRKKSLRKQHLSFAVFLV